MCYVRGRAINGRRVFHIKDTLYNEFTWTNLCSLVKRKWSSGNRGGAKRIETVEQETEQTRGSFYRVVSLVRDPSGHFFTTVSWLIARKDCYGWLPATQPPFPFPTHTHTHTPPATQGISRSGVCECIGFRGRCVFGGWWKQ